MAGENGCWRLDAATPSAALLAHRLLQFQQCHGYSHGRCRGCLARIACGNFRSWCAFMAAPDHYPPARWPLWLFSWLLLVGLYLLLAGQLSWEEGIVAVVAASLALAGVWAQSPLCFTVRQVRWSYLLKLPLPALSDCLRVLGVIAKALIFGRRPTTTFHWVPFLPGENDSVSNTRRALVISALSLAPNSYVASIDLEHERLLVHRLALTRSPEEVDPAWPI